MDARQTDSGPEEPTPRASGAPGRRDGPGLSWSRVLLAVGGFVVMGAVALQMVMRASLDPKEPDGTGTVTIAGEAHEADVCESLEEGIEVGYGAQDEVLYVRDMGPPEIYEDFEVKPERMDGTFLVRRVDGVEQWSDAATVLERTTDGATLEATLDTAGPVTITYVTGGWCDGADPNVWWR